MRTVSDFDCRDILNYIIMTFRKTLLHVWALDLEIFGNWASSWSKVQMWSSFVYATKRVNCDILSSRSECFCSNNNRKLANKLVLSQRRSKLRMNLAQNAGLLIFLVLLSIVMFHDAVNAQVYNYELCLGLEQTECISNEHCDWCHPMLSGGFCSGHFSCY